MVWLCVGALAASACGGGTDGSGAGGTGTTTFTYTPIPKPDGAFTVSFEQKNPAECFVASHETKVGDVTAAATTAVVKDGDDKTVVDCNTVGSGPFQFQGKIDDTSNSGAYLEISIPSISADASKDTPASGALLYASAKTVSGTYQSTDCQFYFENTHQGIDSGKLWVSFTCGTLSASTSTCALPVGYAIFEGCGNVVGE